MLVLSEIREGDIPVRAGIVITDGSNVLGCLPTPTIQYPNLERKYDLPKGHMQKGESPIDAAIRECWEETNIYFEKWKLQFCGKFSVYSEPFFVFKAEIITMPPLRQLSCPSTFMKGAIRSPENCGYGLIPISQISEKFFPELAPIIKTVVNL